jgi:hypothetical protein
MEDIPTHPKNEWSLTREQRAVSYIYIYKRYPKT